MVFSYFLNKNAKKRKILGVVNLISFLNKKTDLILDIFTAEGGPKLLLYHLYSFNVLMVRLELVVADFYDLVFLRLKQFDVERRKPSQFVAAEQRIVVPSDQKGNSVS